MVRKGWSWPVPWNHGRFLPCCLGRIFKALSKGSCILAFFSSGAAVPSGRGAVPFLFERCTSLLSLTPVFLSLHSFHFIFVEYPLYA